MEWHRHNKNCQISYSSQAQNEDLAALAYIYTRAVSHHEAEHKPCCIPEKMLGKDTLAQQLGWQIFAASLSHVPSARAIQIDINDKACRAVLSNNPSETKLIERITITVSRVIGAGLWIM